MKHFNNHKDFFDTETLRGHLKKRSLRGGLYTMTGEGIIFILRLGSTAVLARILIPEHFGLISMVTALTAIAALLKDFGLSLATVQAKKISHEQASALFWINVAVGVIITLILCLLSKLIAWFYADNRLIWITIGISTTFFWGGITVQHQAILWRKMLFARLVGVNVVSTILSIFIAILLAVKGYGYRALVWREIASSFFIAIGTWTACAWIPALPTRNANIGKMIRFGRDITAFNLVEFFSRNLDQILLGKFYGPGLLGIYRQGYQLASLPINSLVYPVQTVAQPALSALQDDALRYRRYYKKIVTSVGFVSMPLAAFLFVNSNDIILLLLGEKWIKAAEIFRIMAVANFLIPVASTTGFVMITCGESKRYFFLGLAKSIILIVALSIGIKWGAVGIAYGQLVTNYIVVLPVLFFAFRNTPISVELFFLSILPSVICSLLMGVALFLFSTMISIQNSFYAVAGSLSIAVVVYFGAWMLMPAGNLRLKEIFSDFASMFTRRKVEEVSVSLE
jgi:O-antigen/teichoic acid export membrane protein